MTNQALAVIQPHDTSIVEEVVAKGDLAKLSPEQRASYYIEYCRSIGLNPQTQPMQYVLLNNKLTLYATKGATDQLRKLHGVSVTRIDKEIVDDLYVVTVAVKDRDGRTDEDMGAVVIARLQGDAKVNAMLKAITKAKRRATLSICGLPLLDETEIETVPAARPIRVDVETGEILDVEPTPLHAAADEGGNGHSVTEPTAKERTKDYREIQNGHYHAAATEREFTEAAQKLYALAPFPDKTSRRDLTGQELHDLALQVKDDVPLMDDGSPPPTVDYANRIAAAIDRAELARIAAEMRGAGVATDWLRAMWKRRSDEVPAMVMVAETRIAGVAGNDKHTQ